MLKILRTREEIQQARTRISQKNVKIGFVPTMGALHEGHLSLVHLCKKNKEVCIASIFVNPTQFNDPEDYKNYPVTRDSDIRMLESAGCDYVFIPSTEEMYPEGTGKKLHIDLGYIGDVLEGSYRPGHFDGVITIVHHLFEAIDPDTAYFGQKDYQQYLVILKMKEYFGFKTEIRLCPIVREPDGLAMSSRNRLLSPAERKLAPIIFKTLSEAVQMLRDHNIDDVRSHGIKKLSSFNSVALDYFEIRNAENLVPIKILEEARKVLICTALKIGKIRLIDNILVD